MSFPTCEACGRPMRLGQVRRHGVCDPNHPAYVPTGFTTGMAKSQAAAETKWTTAQIAQVDAAIEHVARMHQAFTADDIWLRLGSDFPVNKGMAARLNSAARRGLIENTGTTSFSRRGGAHCHNQRLTVWRSRIGGQNPMTLSQKGAR